MTKEQLIKSVNYQIGLKAQDGFHIKEVGTISINFEKSNSLYANMLLKYDEVNKSIHVQVNIVDGKSISDKYTIESVHQDYQNILKELSYE